VQAQWNATHPPVFVFGEEDSGVFLDSFLLCAGWHLRVWEQGAEGQVRARHEDRV